MTDRAWKAFIKVLHAAGYHHDTAHGWRHKQTGRRIYPHEYKQQPDGTTRLNWQYWAEHDFVPPPF